MVSLLCCSVPIGGCSRIDWSIRPESQGVPDANSSEREPPSLY